MASGEGISKVSEPDSVHKTQESSVGVGVRKKRKYNGGDPVDTYLLNQIAKHIKYEELGSLARDLSIEDTVYSNKAAAKDQIWQVSRRKSIENY